MLLFRPIATLRTLGLALLALAATGAAMGQAHDNLQQLAYVRAAVPAPVSDALANHREPAHLAPSDSLRTHTAQEQTLFREVNQERAAAGLPQLTWSEPLAGAALAHAGQMKSRNELSHKFADEADLSIRAAAAGARFSRVAENVAHGHEVLSIHHSLMNSPHHRENILDPDLNSIAISILEADGALWVVEDFTKAVETLTLEQQEARVLSSLVRLNLTGAVATEARSICSRSGASADRPALVARYTTRDPGQLPEQLLVRLTTGAYHRAVVGACEASSGSAFATFQVALLLFR